jgi:hypothetical protein
MQIKTEKIDTLNLTKDVLQRLFIEDTETDTKKVSYEYAYIEKAKAQVMLEEEQIKNSYKIWLSEKKKELDRKIYTNETAKEDGVIAKYRQDYLQFNKQLIDLAYQKTLLQGISRAIEMKANLLISLLNSKKNNLQVDDEIAQWNTKVEKTKI